jgi:hypothetical protein
VNSQELKALLHATPFVPFSIVMVNGQVHHVSNPDVLNVTIQGNVIYEDSVGPMTDINPILIAEVLKPKPTAAG